MFLYNILSILKSERPMFCTHNVNNNKNNIIHAKYIRFFREQENEMSHCYNTIIRFSWLWFIQLVFISIHGLLLLLLL